MNIFLNKKTNIVLSVLLVAVSFVLMLQTLFSKRPLREYAATADVAIACDAESECLPHDVFDDEIIVDSTETETCEDKTESVCQPDTTNSAETTMLTTIDINVAPTIAFATAIVPDIPADYNAQWDAGYLVAIDNPDTAYKCAKITLSYDDRDLLERLCMGEFGTGGFIGASLIAQSVKNAMCFDGYETVAQVIKECRYTGDTDCVANEECKKAVRYIFDENHDAVQHRIMYMYNPVLVQSAFHESQNYILTYENVRFFDRWGY